MRVNAKGKGLSLPIKVSASTILAISLPFMATFLAWTLTAEIVFRQNQAEFSVLAEESERALTHRMDSYRQSLDGGAGLFAASKTVTAEEWRIYTDVLEIKRMLPGISGIGFIEQVATRGIPAFLKKYAERGVKDLVIRPQTGVPEKFVITYIEPLGPNLAALGLDIAFEENRYKAAVHARDTGKSTITRRILLVQDDTASPGFLLLRPLYENGVATSDVAERQAAFKGWVYAPFIGQRLMAGLTKTQGHSLNISVYDGSTADPEALIYSSLPGTGIASDGLFHVAKTLTMMEQDWTVIWESTPVFDSAASSQEPILILIGGVALSLLFAALLLSYAHREDAVRRIVEQKTRAILAREQENKAIVDSAIAGIVLIAQDGVVLSVNAAAERIFGLDAGDIVAKPFGDIVAGIDADGLRALVRPDKDTMSAPDYFSARRQDGSRRDLNLQVNQWKTEDNAIRFTAVILDVTDEKQAADALATAEKRWNYALKGASIGVFDIDLAAGTSIVSDTWKALTGFPENEEIDSQAEFLARVHPDDLPVMQTADLATINGVTERSESEFRFLTPSGDLIWLRSDAFVSKRAADGRALQLLGTMVEITGLKRATAALRASEEKFRSAIENAPVGMALINMNGRIMSANGALCKFLGVKESDISGGEFRALADLSDADAAQEFPVGTTLCPSSDYQGEYQFIHADGHPLWGLLNVSKVQDRDGETEYLIAQILDIYDRKEVDRLKGEFVATISHELRTPLTSIRGSLGLITGAMSADISGRVQDLVFVAHKNCDRLILLINDILDLEKITSDSYRFDLSSQSIGALVAQAVEANQAYAEELGVVLKFADFDSDLYVKVDGARFQQVLSNMLSNAAKFSPSGERVSIWIEPSGEVLRVNVADRGPGISSEFRKKIFRRFSQEDGSATRKKGGTGLGLHIAKQMIEKMGGTMGFESRAGKGTVFWAELAIDLDAPLIKPIGNALAESPAEDRAFG